MFMSSKSSGDKFFAPFPSTRTPLMLPFFEQCPRSTPAGLRPQVLMLEANAGRPVRTNRTEPSSVELVMLVLFMPSRVALNIRDTALSPFSRIGFEALREVLSLLSGEMLRFFPSPRTAVSSPVVWLMKELRDGYIALLESFGSKLSFLTDEGALWSELLPVCVAGLIGPLLMAQGRQGVAGTPRSPECVAPLKTRRVKVLTC